MLIRPAVISGSFAGHRFTRPAQQSLPDTVGYVCFCVRTADGRTLARDPVLPGERGDVRERSVVLALHLIRRLLSGEHD